MGDPVEIQIWPARQRPFRALIAFLWTVGVSTVVFLWMGRWMGAFSLFLLVMWMADFWFPWTLRITREKVMLIRLGKERILPWKTLHRIDITPSGILLVPDDARGWKEAYRSIWIPYRDDKLVQTLEGYYDGTIRRIL